MIYFLASVAIGLFLALIAYFWPQPSRWKCGCRKTKCRL